MKVLLYLFSVLFLANSANAQSSSTVKPTEEKNKLKETKEYYENGQLMLLYFVDTIGRVQGEAKTYFENGKLKKVMSFKDDFQNGLEIEYYQNGKINHKANVLNGKVHGEIKFFSENGQLTAVHNFNNGIETGLKTYDENGNLLYEYVIKGNIYYATEYQEDNMKSEVGTYKMENGELIEIDEWKYFSENGKLKKIGSFTNGKKTGEWKIYWDKGQVQTISIFENGIETESKHFKENGNLHIEVFLKQNFYYATYYQSNKQKSKEGSFKIENEKMIFLNEWRYYDENGELIKINTYENGKLISTKNAKELNDEIDIFGGISTSTTTKEDWEAWEDIKNSTESIKSLQSSYMNKIKGLYSYFGLNDTETYYFECYRDPTSGVLFFKTKYKKDKVYYNGKYYFDVLYEVQVLFKDVNDVTIHNNKILFNLNSNGFLRRAKLQGENWSEYIENNNNFEISIFNEEKRSEAFNAFKYLVEHPYKKE